MMRGPRATESGQPLEAKLEKSKKQILPLGPLEGTRACGRLDFSPN